MPVKKSCGSWRSPITADFLVNSAVSFGEIVVSGQDIWWSETRPDQGGRTAIVRNGSDVVGPEINIRTLVHEYGGGAWWVFGDTLIHTSFDDQRLWSQDLDGIRKPLTPAPEIHRGFRYADGRPTPDGRWYVCVREDHHVDSEPVNELVAVALDGSQEVKTLVSGPDFVSAPRLSPDGTKLVWIQWDHPNLPWDDTELWVGRFQNGEVFDASCVGATGESFFQPEWSSDSVLHVVTDRGGWWNLYRFGDEGFENLTEGEFEIATPQWVFGLSRYAFVGGDIWFAHRDRGVDRLSILKSDRTVQSLDLDVTHISHIKTRDDGVVLIVASWTSEPEILVMTSSEVEVLRPARALDLESSWFPVPEALEFPTSQEEHAYALVYSPRNPHYLPRDDELPPLVVLVHGGPTGCARTSLQLNIAYWTSRGFAVADVDYRGSTGYGRPYRHSLRGLWGIADVDDCVALAEFLVERGDVDGERLAIRGSSAGGFTVLAALVFHDTFDVGASRYGIADLTALATDTHKFEARYLDRLIGRLPEDEMIYRERSPIYHVEKLSTPLLLLQGSEDTIVPATQAHRMAEVLADVKVRHALVEFPDEGHGFRKAANLIRAQEAELAFFGDCFGFIPADRLSPLRIHE